MDGTVASAAAGGKHLFDFALTTEHAFGILAGMRRTRVRWSRLAVLATSAALAVSVAGGAARAGAGPLFGAEPAAHRTYTVRSGDTVWGIARRLAGPEADPRPLVDRILLENALDAGSLRAGQTIVLPGA
jgi:nucleoid-associated protein YgaU